MVSGFLFTVIFNLGMLLETQSIYVLPDLSLLLMAAWKQEEEEKIKLQRVVRELLGQKARLEI